MARRVYHGLAALAALLVGVGGLAPSPRAQTSADLEPGQSRTEIGIGLGADHGLLRFQGRQYQALPPDLDFETEIGAAPLVAVSVRHFMSRAWGLRLQGSFGLVPGLDLPASLATDMAGEAVTLRVYTHTALAVLSYRFFFSSSPRALALQAEVGVQHLGYTLQDQDPPLLVSTTYLGPTALLGLHLPLGSLASLTLAGGGYFPWSVTEDPADSGELARAWALTLSAAAELRLGSAFTLELSARRTALSITFEGHGTRGPSGAGVFEGRSDDTLDQALLLLQYRVR